MRRLKRVFDVSLMWSNQPQVCEKCVVVVVVVVRVADVHRVWCDNAFFVFLLEVDTEG